MEILVEQTGVGMACIRIPTSRARVTEKQTQPSIFKGLETTNVFATA